MVNSAKTYVLKLIAKVNIKQVKPLTLVAVNMKTNGTILKRFKMARMEKIVS